MGAAQLEGVPAAQVNVPYGGSTNGRADRTGEHLVATHCCFCGVQCGMFLRVSGAGAVFGVEPRNHDINKMKLCPKGVTAYQQVNHPDRLTFPSSKPATPRWRWILSALCIPTHGRRCQR